MGATVTWKREGLAFAGTADTGLTVDLASALDIEPSLAGFRPMEMMAVGLAGCTAMDVISILTKKRQDIRDFQVNIITRSAEEHPHVWTAVKLEYVVAGHQIDPAAVERAIELSREKYCPAQAMIRQAVNIEHSYRIVETGGS
ncbi:MAG: OsmC family protein [Chloroflexi bacterium]|nr:OsmC family protein [Chloroflexota bacterium]